MSTGARNLRSSRTHLISNEGLSTSSEAATIGEADATMELEEKKKRIASAKRIFKNLARSYLDERAPPDRNSVRELWKYKDILDLTTVFGWRDELDIRRVGLFEHG